MNDVELIEVPWSEAPSLEAIVSAGDDMWMPLHGDATKRCWWVGCQRWDIKPYKSPYRSTYFLYCPEHRDKVNTYLRRGGIM